MAAIKASCPFGSKGYCAGGQVYVKQDRNLCAKETAKLKWISFCYKVICRRHNVALTPTLSFCFFSSTAAAASWKESCSWRQGRRSVHRQRAHQTTRVEPLNDANSQAFKGKTLSEMLSNPFDVMTMKHTRARTRCYERNSSAVSRCG